jgi:hypothetical protein
VERRRSSFEKVDLQDYIVLAGEAKEETIHEKDDADEK